MRAKKKRTAAENVRCLVSLSKKNLRKTSHRPVASTPSPSPLYVRGLKDNLPLSYYKVPLHLLRSNTQKLLSNTQMALLWSNGIKLRKKPNAKNQTKNKLRQFIKSLSLVYSKNKTACKTGSNYNLNQFTSQKS